jgi:hypothetical protein
VRVAYHSDGCSFEEAILKTFHSEFFRFNLNRSVGAGEACLPIGALDHWNFPFSPPQRRIAESQNDHNFDGPSGGNPWPSLRNPSHCGAKKELGLRRPFNSKKMVGLLGLTLHDVNESSEALERVN